MKFILTSIAVLSALYVQIQAQIPVAVSFDEAYDNLAGSTSTVACGNGTNGLASRFPTFGSFPNFPNIGGAFVVSGPGSTNCGTCWQLASEVNSINVVAIDVASNGFNIARAALNFLGGGFEPFHPINATATQVPASSCGL